MARPRSTARRNISQGATRCSATPFATGLISLSCGVKRSQNSTPGPAGSRPRSSPKVPPMGDDQAHASRDRHLFGPGPKRILSLDGGGVRGVISVAFLERIETILRAQDGHQVSDHFDLIGGTSTGAIIATGLALGKTTGEMKDIYHRLAPLAFRASRFRIPFLQPKFDVTGLRREIGAIVGEQTLDSTELRTGLGIVAKRAD